MARNKSAADHATATTVAKPASIPTALRPGPENGGAVRAPAPATASEIAADDPAYGLRFHIRENISYHAAREQFLSRLNRVLIGLQVMLGTSAIAVLAENLPGLAVAVLGVSALSGVLLLVLDPAGAAREHRVFRGRYHDLLADLEEGPCDEIQLKRARGTMQRIASGEPPVYRAVQALAYNAAVNATLAEEEARKHRYRVRGWRRLFGNWFPMRGMRLAREIVRPTG
ncbi:hypothetical protein [Allomesorhizobium alhagi]|uniref:SMODS and SLOG-associating 2TM effector domain-containing protein n=1 Tax=Mesorhizobium alhagi CCNWXJ12-2 TaxID=1107882 RepID=H0HQY5_9HYPH|nr:hypothetical protein [Mesorhizobium alhagi]EHK56847.1 hypothetical protein MAXJ12_12837 [Mesorhizobium alhagi CCNWXJ12-2]